MLAGISPTCKYSWLYSWWILISMLVLEKLVYRTTVGAVTPVLNVYILEGLSSRVRQSSDNVELDVKRSKDSSAESGRRIQQPRRRNLYYKFATAALRMILILNMGFYYRILELGTRNADLNSDTGSQPATWAFEQVNFLVKSTCSEHINLEHFKSHHTSTLLLFRAITTRLLFLTNSSWVSQLQGFLQSVLIITFLDDIFAFFISSTIRRWGFTLGWVSPRTS